MNWQQDSRGTTAAAACEDLHLMIVAAQQAECPQHLDLGWWQSSPGCVVVYVRGWAMALAGMSK